MPIVVSDELQELFGLRDRRAAIIERFIIVEAELQGNMQRNANKEFVEVHDLDVTNNLMQPLLDIKEELEAVNSKFEQKKNFFISILESTGCLRLACSNKEFDEEGDFEYVPYMISVVKKNEGEADLVIQHKNATSKA